MKEIKITLTLREAIEYLRLIGPTSFADRQQFFAQYVDPQPVEMGPAEDIFSRIYNKIQRELNRVYVKKGYLVNGYVFDDPELARELSDVYTEVLIVCRW